MGQMLRVDGSLVRSSVAGLHHKNRVLGFLTKLRDRTRLGVFIRAKVCTVISNTLRGYLRI